MNTDFNSDFNKIRSLFLKRFMVRPSVLKNKRKISNKNAISLKGNQSTKK